jgi:hypothetical protein
MAISRPFLLAVLGALLLGATALAVQNARDTTNNDAAPAAINADTAPAPAPAQNSTAAPTDTLKSAFDLSDVKSGRFAAKLSIRVSGAQARIRVSGAFDTSSDDALAHFDARARLSSGRQTIGGGVVSLGDKAYFVKGDTGWRVPGEVWKPLVQKATASGAKLPLVIHPETWARDVKSVGTESVGGAATEHLSGNLDAQAFSDDTDRAVGSKPQMKISRVKRSDFDVWVGKDDHVVRRLSAEVVLPHRVSFALDLRLSDVNKPQKIQAPAHVRTGAPGGSTGLFAGSVVGAVNGVTGTKTASLAALSSPNPGRAARAVHKHKKVVILFTNQRGLDDRALGPVIRNVDRRTKALVLTDPVDAVDRYGKLVQDLGVSETPSIVIIDSKGKSRLIEGYVDSDTLTQAVADAR